MSIEPEPADESAERPSEHAELTARFGETELAVSAGSRTPQGLVRVTRLLLGTAACLAGLAAFVVLTLNGQPVEAYVALVAGAAFAGLILWVSR